MAFGRSKETSTKNVPLFTTDQIVTPDGYKAEYVGVIHLSLPGRNIVSGKLFDKYQEHVNKSGVDAVFGVKMQSIEILNSSEIVVYGTGVRFVEA